jgi:hypothetical protein
MQSVMQIDLWGEIYFLSCSQNLIVDSMLAYGYIWRFKSETSSKAAKAHLGVLYKEKLKCQEAYLHMLVTAGIRILLSLLLSMLVQRPLMNCFKNTIFFSFKLCTLKLYKNASNKALDWFNLFFPFFI